MIASGRVTNTRSVATRQLTRYRRISSTFRNWRLHGRMAPRTRVATTPGSDGRSNARPRNRSAARESRRSSTAIPAPSQTRAGARTRWSRPTVVVSATRGDGWSSVKQFAASSWRRASPADAAQRFKRVRPFRVCGGRATYGDATQRTREIRQQTDSPPPQGQPPTRGQARRLRRLHEHGPRGHGGDEGRTGATDRDRRPPRQQRRRDRPSIGSRQAFQPPTKTQGSRIRRGQRNRNDVTLSVVFVLARSRIPHAWGRVRFFAITIWVTREFRFEERVSQRKTSDIMSTFPTSTATMESSSCRSMPQTFISGVGASDYLRTVQEVLD